jgi:hypothetical protein
MRRPAGFALAGTLLWLLPFVAVPTTQTPAPGAETPEYVARQVELRDTGRDSRLGMTMRLFDRQNCAARAVREIAC